MGEKRNFGGGGGGSPPQAYLDGDISLSVSLPGILHISS